MLAPFSPPDDNGAGGTDVCTNAAPYAHASADGAGYVLLFCHNPDCSQGKGFLSREETLTGPQLRTAFRSFPLLYLPKALAVGNEDLIDNLHAIQ
jgi:hypothetical protein